MASLIGNELMLGLQTIAIAIDHLQQDIIRHASVDCDTKLNVNTDSDIFGKTNFLPQHTISEHDRAEKTTDMAPMTISCDGTASTSASLIAEVARAREMPETASSEGGDKSIQFKKQEQHKLKQMIDGLEDTIQTSSLSKTVIAGLGPKMEGVRRDLDQLQKQNIEFERELNELKAENVRLEEKTEMTEKEKKRLNTELMLTQKEKDRKRAQLLSAKEEETKQENQLTVLSEKIDGLRGELESRGKEIKSQENDLKLKNCEFKAQLKEFDIMKEAGEKITHRLEELKEEEKEREKELRSRQEELALKDAELQSHLTKLKKMEDTQENDMQKLEELKENVMRTDEETKVTEEKHEKQLAELKRLCLEREKDIEKGLLELSVKNECLQKQKSEKDRQDKQAQESNKAVEQLLEVQKHLKSKERELQRDVEKQRGILGKTKDKRDAIFKRIKEQEGIIRRKSGELSEKRLEKEMETAQNKESELEKHLKAIKDNLTSLEIRNKNRQNQRKKIDSGLNRCNRRC